MSIVERPYDPFVITLEPWTSGDLSLVERFLGDAGMMEHLGGPQGSKEIAETHERYLTVAANGTGWMFKIVAVPDVVGSVGYWEREWRGEAVYEAGWSVFPEFQGRGFAREGASLVLDHARAHGIRRYLHAFPSVTNPPSNVICKRLGFTLQGECDFEYPKGHLMRCNDWRIDLLSP